MKESCVLRSAAGFALAAAVALLAAGPASALHLSLVGDERLNEFGSGLPGTPYDTAPDGVDYDQIGSGDPHPGEVLVTGEVPELNYHTTGDPLTNVNVPFGTPLVFTLDAELTDITLAPAGGTFVQATLEFQGTADGNPDLVVTDPSDNSVLLEADLTGGLLNGNPVAALTTIFTFDAASPPENATGQTFAFFDVDAGSAWASLFDAGLGALNVPLGTGVVTNFEIGDADGSFDFDDIAAALGATPGPADLISNTAEANGSVFALSTSQFVVPEPATLVLMGLGLVGLGALSRALPAGRS